MKVSLQAGIVGFETNISEFCQVVRDFVGAALDQKARQALKKMIAEVDKDFDLVIEVLTPLYAINTNEDLRAQWPAVFQKFKKLYFTQWGSLSTSCGIVMDQLQRVRDAHNWKRRIPVLRDAVKKLDDLGQRWMCNDEELYRSMNAFMKSLNTTLVDVNGQLKTPEKALRKLHAFLRGKESSIVKIKAYSNELKLISARF